MPAALEQVLAPGYLDGLAARSLPELRSMRAECQEVETGLSLLRRVVQGHLDIVGLEVERRAGGAGAGDRGELLAQLPELLADRTTSSGTGRLSSLMAPEAMDPGLEAELSGLVGGGPVDPSGYDDAGLRALADGLATLEGRISQHRRALFDRLDAVQEEIARRYRTGDASVDTLLGS
jgi:hypothetical protein